MARVDRRVLIGGAVAAATGTFLWLGGGGLIRRLVEPTPPEGPPRYLTGLEWKTLDAAQQRILPSAEDSPGAREVNAIGYLDAVLKDADIEEETVARVHAGAARMHAFALERGAEDFAALDGEAQDAALGLFTGAWEERLVLRELVAFTLEAFLCDPVRGGNPDEIGWGWAHHRPGFPRPEAGWRPIGKGPRTPLDR